MTDDDEESFIIESSQHMKKNDKESFIGTGQILKDGESSITTDITDPLEMDVEMDMEVEAYNCANDDNCERWVGPLVLFSTFILLLLFFLGVFTGNTNWCFFSFLGMWISGLLVFIFAGVTSVVQWIRGWSDNRETIERMNARRRKDILETDGRKKERRRRKSSGRQKSIVGFLSLMSIGH